MALPVTPIDDYVNHIFREHNQEAFYLANLRAEERRNITVEKGNKTENWKAVRGFWDGSTKIDGSSGCGVVIKGVDWDTWITIIKIAEPLRKCTAMAAAVVGVSVLSGILDLVLVKNIGVKAVSECIDAVIK